MKNKQIEKELSVLTRRDLLRSITIAASAALGSQHLTGCTLVADEDAVLATQLTPKAHLRSISTMSIRAQIVCTVNQEKLAAFMPFLKKNLPNVRSFDGCLRVTVLMNNENGLMVLDEEWLSVDHHQKYMASIDESGILGQLALYLDGPPEIRYLDQILI